MLNIKNASGFRRGVAGLSLILGPILVLLGSLTQTGTDAEGAAYLDALAESPGATQVSTLLSYFGFVLLVPGIVGAVHVVRQRGVVLAHVAGAIALLGAVGIAALVFTTFYDLSIAENAPRGPGVAVYDGVEGYPLAFLPAGLGFLGLPIGMVLLMVALWRGGIAPVWAWPVVLVAFLVLQFELGGVKVGTIVGSIGLTVAFGYVGVKLLTMSDAVWERGGAPGGGSPRVA